MPKRGSYIRSKSVCIRITWISQFKKKRCKRSEKKCPWRVCVGWARVAVLPSLSSAGCHRSRAFCCDFFLLSAREMCRERELAQVKFYDFFLFFSLTDSRISPAIFVYLVCLRRNESTAPTQWFRPYRSTAPYSRPLLSNTLNVYYFIQSLYTDR
jgi:hypothetical protein